MAKDDLKLKDLFTHLVNWIKEKLSEQDTKIAANKYTLPEATETELGGVKIRKTYSDGPEGRGRPGDTTDVATVKYVKDINAAANMGLGFVLEQFEKKIQPATASKDGSVKILDNEDSVLYPDYHGTAAGVSHVDNVIKSMEVGMSAQLNLKQDKIKIVTTEPTASSTASDPEGTIYFKV